MLDLIMSTENLLRNNEKFPNFFQKQIRDMFSVMLLFVIIHFLVSIIIVLSLKGRNGNLFLKFAGVILSQQDVFLLFPHLAMCLGACREQEFMLLIISM